MGVPVAPDRLAGADQMLEELADSGIGHDAHDHARRGGRGMRLGDVLRRVDKSQLRVVRDGEEVHEAWDG